MVFIVQYIGVPDGGSLLGVEQHQVPQPPLHPQEVSRGGVTLGSGQYREVLRAGLLPMDLRSTLIYTQVPGDLSVPKGCP